MAVLLSIAAIVALWFFRRPPLVRAADSMVVAMRDGDGNGIFDAAISDERNCSDLTPEKVHQAWAILIGPNITASQFVSKDRTDVESNQTQAVASFNYHTEQGDPWTLTVIANQCAEGTKANVIYGMLATASIFSADGHTYSTLTSEVALQGVRRYRQRLEAIGIHSVMLAPGSCVSWDQLETRLQPR